MPLERELEVVLRYRPQHHAFQTLQVVESVMRGHADLIQQRLARVISRQPQQPPQRQGTWSPSSTLQGDHVLDYLGHQPRQFHFLD